MFKVGQLVTGHVTLSVNLVFILLILVHGISMDPFSKSSFYITDTGTWNFPWTLPVNVVFILLILVHGNFHGPLR